MTKQLTWQEFGERSLLCFEGISPLQESLFCLDRSIRIYLCPRQQQTRNSFNLSFEFSEHRSAFPADSEVISNGSHPRNGHLSVQVGKQLIVDKMFEWPARPAKRAKLWGKQYSVFLSPILRLGAAAKNHSIPRPMAHVHGSQ